MARRKAEPQPVDGTPLREIAERLGIMHPPIRDLVARYGYGEDVRTNGLGDEVLPVEVAARFLATYGEQVNDRANKFAAYRRYLAEKWDKEKREKLADRNRIAAQREEKAKKAVEARRAELERQKAAAAAAAADSGELSFSEWEAKYGNS